MHPRKEDPTGRDALERWATGALRQLPEPRAPGDLLHEVLRRVREQEATPWHRRPWMTWPAWLRWTSALGLALVLALAWAGAGDALEAGKALARQAGVVRAAEDAAGSLGRMTSAVLAVAGRLPGQLPRPVLVACGVMLAALWISTVGLGAALWRLLRTPA